MKRQMQTARELADYENLRRNVEHYAPELLGRQNSRDTTLGR